MDLFIIQVDGLDVAITESEMPAVNQARRLASEDPTVEARVVRIDEDWIELVPRFRPAEAATA